MPTTTCTRCGLDISLCTCPEPGSEADVKGRVWRHCEEGLSMTKASMARFMMFVLKNDIEIGERCGSGEMTRAKPPAPAGPAAEMPI